MKSEELEVIELVELVDALRDTGTINLLAGMAILDSDGHAADHG